MFHLLCPGSGDCWKPGLRLCSLRRGSRTRGLWRFVDRGPGNRDSGDRDSVVLGIVQRSCSWIFIGANGIFTNCVVKYVYI